MGRLIFVAMLFWLTTAATAKEIYSFRVGLWSAGAYSSDTTGQFSHCAANAPYKSGITFFVWLTSDFQWQIGFYDQNWRLTPDQTFNVEYRFDRGPWLSAEARASDAQMFRIQMRSDSTLVDLFRHGRVMNLRIGRQQYGFNLTNTARLLTELAQCVGRFAAAAPPSQPPVAEAPASSAPAATPSEPAESSGTGIIVAAKGYVLTNNHVVSECDAATVQRAGNASELAAVVAKDRVNDLALLKLPNPVNPTNVAGIRRGTLKAGDLVAVFGFPLSSILSTSGNIVAGNVTSLAGIADDSRMLQMSAPVQPGNSGGPLLDMSGNVIGVVTSKLDDKAVADAVGSVPQNVNFAIKGNFATNFLEAQSVEYVTAPDTPALTLSDVAERARKFTVRITCTAQE